MAAIALQVERQKMAFQLHPIKSKPSSPATRNQQQFLPVVQLFSGDALFTGEYVISQNALASAESAAGVFYGRKLPLLEDDFDIDHVLDLAIQMEFDRSKKTGPSGSDDLAPFAAHGSVGSLPKKEDFYRTFDGGLSSEDQMLSVDAILEKLQVGVHIYIKD